MNYIIFTDLDGTLLDHDDYSYTAALPALDLVKRNGTPLVLASSKTACEVAPLRDELGFAHYPAIVENGAGILAADAAAPMQIEPRGDYVALRARLAELPADLRALFVGFGDMTAEEVAAETGLSLVGAELSKIRQFSEPGIWKGSADRQVEFERRLAKWGIETSHGGRFLTLSFGRSKAERMREIIDHTDISCNNPTIVALGDAPNDAEMLAAADIGIVIANPAGTPLADHWAGKTGTILTSTHPGPEGWNEMVTALYDDTGQSH